MNARVHRQMGRRKRSIARRFRIRPGAGRPEPMMATSNIRYQIAEKVRAIAPGGIGAIHLMARKLGLIRDIDERLHLFKRHLPYDASVHVLSIADNLLAGGSRPEHLEVRRNEEVYPDALGAQRLPDPTTAGDRSRRSSSRARGLARSARGSDYHADWGRINEEPAMSDAMHHPFDRRAFLGGVVAAAIGPAAARGREEAGSLPPVRAITRGPKHHWFGYYDKLEFDPSGRYVLGMEVGFEHRSPRPDDAIKVGMVDLQDGDRWVELGESRAWNWQQGCMLQWLPGSKAEVIWNDREGDRFVSHILDVATKSRRTIPAPVYALGPDAAWAIAPDFRRLNDARPGYGYAGLPDPGRDLAAPDDAGLWRVDLRTGRSDLLFSFRHVAGLPYLKGEPKDAKHWFNHLLVAPDGSRFCFLHRWRTPADGTNFQTRLITADPDGSNLHVLDPHGKTSHFIWRDPRHILAWASHPSHGEKFYLYEDHTDRVEVVAPDVMTVNGHCTYLPGNRWILNDTYPDKQRNQNPYLYDTRTGKRHPLGHFRSPAEYAGEWRCDNHPRFSPDGRSVVIDSPHVGPGRQLYLIDVGGIVARA